MEANKTYNIICDSPLNLCDYLVDESQGFIHYEMPFPDIYCSIAIKEMV